MYSYVGILNVSVHFLDNKCIRTESLMNAQLVAMFTNSYLDLMFQKCNTANLDVSRYMAP